MNVSCVQRRQPRGYLLNFYESVRDYQTIVRLSGQMQRRYQRRLGGDGGRYRSRVAERRDYLGWCRLARRDDA